MEELAIKIEHVSKEYRLGAIGGAAETFFGKNKAKGMEAKLALNEALTKIKK